MILRRACDAPSSTPLQYAPPARPGTARYPCYTSPSGGKTEAPYPSPAPSGRPPSRLNDFKERLPPPRQHAPPARPAAKTRCGPLPPLYLALRQEDPSPSPFSSPSGCSSERLNDFKERLRRPTSPRRQPPPPVRPGAARYPRYTSPSGEKTEAPHPSPTSLWLFTLKVE